jgi:hypothetical protein
LVTDPAGTAAAGVAVTATNVETGAKFYAITSQAGFYAIPEIPAGKYTITAILLGFKTFRREDVIVYPEQLLKLDVSLEVGAPGDLLTRAEAMRKLLAARANLQAPPRPNLPVCSIPLLPMQQAQSTAPMPSPTLPDLDNIDKGIIGAMPAPPCDLNLVIGGNLPGAPPTIAPLPVTPPR